MYWNPKGINEFDKENGSYGKEGLRFVGLRKKETSNRIYEKIPLKGLKKERVGLHYREG